MNQYCAGKFVNWAKAENCDIKEESQEAKDENCMT